jgi:Putative transposase DNA-binding domain
MAVDVIVERLKARQFFKKEHIPKLRQAVAQHHYITSFATFLVKAVFLESVLPAWEAWFLKTQGNPEHGPPPQRLSVSAKILCIAFTLTQSKPLQRRQGEHKVVGDATANNLAWGSLEWWQSTLSRTWTQTFATQGAGLEKGQSLSLSYALDYAADQLVAAYETNIKERFEGYVRRYVIESLRRLELPQTNFQTWSVNNSSTTRRVCRNATEASLRKRYSAFLELNIQRAINDVLKERYGNDALCEVPEFATWLEEQRSILVPHVSRRPPECKDISDHIDKEPWDFIPHMLVLNKRLEAMADADALRVPDTSSPRHRKIKLFNPLLLRKSFVPGHMVLDTTQLLHLLIDGKEDIEDMKQYFKGVHNVVLKHLTDKSTLASSFKKQTGDDDVSQVDEAQHAQRVWQYLCRLDPSNNKHATRVLSQKRRGDDDTLPKVFRFGRMVRTDGYNVSVIMTTAPNRLGRHRINRRIVAAMPALNAKTCETVQATVFNTPSYNIVSADPGKKDILTMVDGCGRVLRYSSARRDLECGFTRSNERLETSSFFRILKGLTLQWTSADGEAIVLSSPNVTTVTTRYLSRFNTKTCRLDRFMALVQARLHIDKHMRGFYTSGFLRHQKTTSYWNKKRSQDRLVDRIRSTYGVSCTGHATAVFVMWGNWGRHPNALRGSASTPGIGLRRFIHHRLCHDRRSKETCLEGGTYTVFEGQTSSVCDVCGGKVTNGTDKRGQRTRRLLKCRHCGRQLGRDVLGALNILACGRSLLESGTRPLYLQHPNDHEAT